MMAGLAGGGRGKMSGSRMVTSAMRGDFRVSSVTRAEFLSLVHGHH